MGRVPTSTYRRGVERGAATPEELETLFEDVSILRDLPALTNLFCHDAVFGMPGEQGEARGAKAISWRIDRLWRSGLTPVAEVRRVLQAGQIALVVGHGISVMRRSADGAWRYVICMPQFEERHTKETA